ncbi:MAG: hypothetical protein GWM98_03565 [Nitrospinaceae bacterium]|nr:isoprenylcysteine carboxylmethyltransferase family protein [Nitrospinaceae bacterium]NIS84162.1 isoprenylcysteine carboxylmethyltransferase family protein [Nitrospinaceae bacterium]NIT80965.1 isoprenylcysteine carboxylmethyltransferase family protein [Nitrospinaceae bacterium]NIU95359.1 hypothetical protein [Nitrospinaceae bacterium]NIY14013.1 hypothetical protein [Nitrospinaceae bacterium]
MKVTPRLIQVFFIAPFNIMIVIPALILGFSRETDFWGLRGLSFSATRTVTGILLIGLGLALTWKSVSRFTEEGDGTPAPWAPPRFLVIEGPYRYVRNPMVEGVFGVLLGEAVLFGSPGLFFWFLFFLAANLLYTPLVEESRLARRFGESYRTYRRNVPRWVPRLQPWKGPDENS